MKKYRLKKDLPGIEVGTIITSVDGTGYKLEGFDVKYVVGVGWIENNPDWFEEVKEVNPILWKPESGEGYYITDPDGVYELQNIEQSSTDVQFGRYIFYPNEESAEKARNRQLAYVELIRAIARGNGDWVADWGDCTINYFFMFNPNDRDLEINSVNNVQHLPPELYMKSEEVAEQILEDLGEDKIKLAMGWR